MDENIMFEKFSDYTGRETELIGKYVLYVDGTYHYPSKHIRKIGTVSKTGFRIFERGDVTLDKSMLFSLQTGDKKGEKTRFEPNPKCTLLTEIGRDTLIEEWKNNKIRKKLIEDIKDKVNDISYLKVSIETLTEITALLDDILKEVNKQMSTGYRRQATVEYVLFDLVYSAYFERFDGDKNGWIRSRYVGDAKSFDSINELLTYFEDVHTNILNCEIKMIVK